MVLIVVVMVAVVVIAIVLVLGVGAQIGATRNVREDDGFEVARDADRRARYFAEHPEELIGDVDA